MAVSHGRSEGMFARDCTPHLPAQTKNKLFVDASTVEIILHIYEAAQGLKPCPCLGQKKFLKYIPCFGQSPQFYYPV